MGHGNGVGRVGDGSTGSSGGRGDSRCGDTSAGSGTAGTARNNGGYKGDGGGNGSHDTRVSGDPSSANTSEVGQSILDLLLGGTPGLDTRDDLVGEVLVRAEALGITVGGTLGNNAKPGVDALRHNVRARRSRHRAGDRRGLSSTSDGGGARTRTRESAGGGSSALGAGGVSGSHSDGRQGAGSDHSCGRSRADSAGHRAGGDSLISSDVGGGILRRHSGRASANTGGNGGSSDSAGGSRARLARTRSSLSRARSSRSSRLAGSGSSLGHRAHSSRDGNCRGDHGSGISRAVGNSWSTAGNRDLAGSVHSRGSPLGRSARARSGRGNRRAAARASRARGRSSRGSLGRNRSAGSGLGRRRSSRSSRLASGGSSLGHRANSGRDGDGRGDHSGRVSRAVGDSRSTAGDSDLAGGVHSGSSPLGRSAGTRSDTGSRGSSSRDRVRRYTRHGRADGARSSRDGSGRDRSNRGRAAARGGRRQGRSGAGSAVKANAVDTKIAAIVVTVVR